MSAEQNAKNKTVKAPPPMDMRLKLEIQELLAEVNDYLWLYHGRPQWVLRKLQFCPNTLLQDDLDQMKTLLDKAPNLDELVKCRKLMGALAPNDENKERVSYLERGIENIKKVKETLTELIARVTVQLSQNAPPVLNNLDSINKVKFASMTDGKPKSATLHVHGKTAKTPPPPPPPQTNEKSTSKSNKTTEPTKKDAAKSKAEAKK